MPVKSIVMAFVLSGWLVALVLAGLIVAYTSFFGLAVLGLVVLFLGVIVDQERDGAVGAGVTPGFMAHQLRARLQMSRAEHGALRAEQALEARSTRLIKCLASAMILIGLGGFWIFQL
jgi:hypothetical protein